jgi:hypothetical protein
MAYYLVTAKPDIALLPELRARLDSGEIDKMRPFGHALHNGLHNARLQPDGSAIWEEEDYCVPPLAQERAAVLDDYFTDLKVQTVQPNAGWQQIESLPEMFATLLPPD